jgi:hypothetical protein
MFAADLPAAREECVASNGDELEGAGLRLF